MTATGADVQDLALERIDVARQRSLYRGEWVPVTVTRADIPVRGRSTPLPFEIWTTRNGPIFADTDLDWEAPPSWLSPEGRSGDERRAYSLRWEAAGDMAGATRLLGRPYAISGHVVHGRKLGRDLGFRTLNLRFPSHRPAAQGIFVVQVHGLAGRPLPGVASLGVRPTVEDAGRVLLEVHCLEWPEGVAIEGGYARILRVDLLHKLHDERRYDGLEALRAGIAQDVVDARDWFAARPPP